MREGNCSPSGSTALTVVEPQIRAPRPHRVTYNDAAFITHLIAMAEQVPQMREKCRAAPLEAETVYQDAIKRFRARRVL
jgi:hypothetical protein